MTISPHEWKYWLQMIILRIDKNNSTSSFDNVVDVETAL